MVIEATLIGIAVLLILVPVAIGAWWGLLRLMDKLAGVNFSEEIQEFSPHDKAIYFGLRALATAYLMAALFARFI